MILPVVECFLRIIQGKFYKPLIIAPISVPKKVIEKEESKDLKSDIVKPPEKREEVIQISSLEELTEVILKNVGVVIDFWSPTCPPCLILRPYFDKFAKENQSDLIKFCAVNVAQNQEIALAYQISTIPTLYYYYRVCYLNLIITFSLGRSL